MTGMIAAMVFDFIPIPPVAAVLIAAILMVLTGCFRNVEDAYKTINWESIVLIAAMLPMSLALEKTGASNLISEKLVSGLGDYGPLVLMAESISRLLCSPCSSAIRQQRYWWLPSRYNRPWQSGSVPTRSCWP